MRDDPNAVLEENNADVFTALRELVLNRYTTGLIYGLVGAWVEQQARRETRQQLADRGHGGNRFIEYPSAVLEILVWPVLVVGLVLLAVYDLLQD